MGEPRTVRQLLDELGRWRVRAARGTGKARVSLRDLSATSGVPLSSLSKYLSGATLMPPDVLDAIVLALGATPAEASAWAQAWEDAAAAHLRLEDPAATPGTVPRLLPLDVTDFTGREDALTDLDGLLAGRVAVAPAIAAIAGTAGVGKTALAVHWAHRIAGRFPDGQLYVNLRGYDPDEPMRTQTALELLLRALGADSVPTDPDLRVAAYRGILAAKQVLVVLDNARSVDQVRPLIPGVPGCLAVVTSRDNLTGLVARDGAHRLNLECLSASEATDLLVRLLGAPRVAAEPQACDDLVRLCVGLPLALRVAAERIARRPDTPLADLVAELADHALRLDLLDADGDTLSDMRAVFSWSLRGIPDPAVRLFRLLGLAPGPDLDAHGAANLAGLTLPKVRTLLETLSAAHLLDRTGSARYGMHDLLRVYAIEQATACLPEPECRAALTRLLDWYLTEAITASDLINPNRRQLPGPVPRAMLPGPALEDPAAARTWLEAERPNLMAAVRLAADDAWPDHAWQLPATLWSFFFEAGYKEDWIDANQRGLAAARSTGNLYAQADALHALGNAALTQSRYEEALDHLDEALRCWRAIGERRGEAATLNTLGSAYHRMQRYSEAQDYFQLAFAANQDNGDRFAQALNMANLALTAGSLGHYREAITRFAAVMDRLDEVGDRRWHPQTLGNMGRLRIRLGDHAGAAADLHRAAELGEEIGNRRSLGFILNGLAMVHIARGEHEEAADHASRVLEICALTGDPDDESHALALLGQARCGQGDTGNGLELLWRALAVCASHDSPRWASTIRNGLGEVLLAGDDPAAALKEFQTALSTSLETTDAYEQARAEYGVARARRALGEPWQEPLGRALEIAASLQIPEAAAMRAELREG